MGIFEADGHFMYCAAPEEEWNKLLINGMTVGKGEIQPDEFYAVVRKRIERTLIRTVRHRRFGPRTLLLMIVISNTYDVSLML